RRVLQSGGSHFPRRSCASELDGPRQYAGRAGSVCGGVGLRANGGGGRGLTRAGYVQQLQRCKFLTVWNRSNDIDATENSALLLLLGPDWRQSLGRSPTMTAYYTTKIQPLNTAGLKSDSL